MRKKAVLSVSGGMDSTGLLLNLLSKDFDVSVLSFNYGQKHKVELERLKSNILYLKTKNIIVEHTIMDLSDVMSKFNSALTSSDIEVPEGHYAQDNMKLTVVPNRNAIFSSIVYGYALSLATKNNTDVTIGLGVHSGDHTIYPDCRQDFFDAIENAFRIGNWESEKVNYYLPYIKEDKFYILKDSIESCKILDLEFDTIFRNTNTCYNPTEEGLSCGKCGSCSERLEAFTFLNRKDPVIYKGDK